jgi:cyclohexanone monooxygenase
MDHNGNSNGSETQAATLLPPEVDIDALREKYGLERDKRLRALGSDQYTLTDGANAHFEDDPYADPPTPRAPVVEEMDVLIIGAGFGGVMTAVTLLDAGVDDFRILDVAADFGGTWYWNRYPGVRCDIESYIYLPYLERTGYVPTERYVTGEEIFGYFQMVARHFDLGKHALFQTKVRGMEWDEDAARWIVTTSRGDELRPRFVATQSGIFSKPKLPGIPGLESFKGRAFHTARWDYEYTGGSPEERLTRLKDKRVGVIGTGVTALQVVPKVAEAAQRLTVFQRTPTAVGVRDNAPTDAEWFKSLPPGWQKAREDTFNRLIMLEPVDCPIDDGWTRCFRHLRDALGELSPEEMTPEKIDAALELADFEWNEMIRSRVDTVVRDSETADRLKAYYRSLCKRPGFSDEYLDVFDRDAVTLVDTSASGIDRITERGIVVDGIEHELDCLIFATGFEHATNWTHQAGYEVVARGAHLSEKWANGIRTYHGFFSHGFPNIFFMGLTQTGTTISVPHMLQEQADHVTHVVRRCLAEGIASVEAKLEAEEAWQDVIAAKSAERRAFQEACTPGFFNAEGRPDDPRSAFGSGMYQPSTEFFAMLERWREAGDFEGLQRD